MVLFWRDENLGTGAVVFDGTSDGPKFFFFYERAVTVSKTDEEKSSTQFGYLDGAAFNFYQENFPSDGESSKNKRKTTSMSIESSLSNSLSR